MSCVLQGTSMNTFEAKSSYRMFCRMPGRATLSFVVLAVFVFVEHGFAFSNHGRSNPYAQESGNQDTNNAQTKQAEEKIIELFKSHALIGLGEQHRQASYHAFLQGLLKNSKFPGAVNDIVIECGNSRYQEIADRYVNGEDVERSELVKCWRDTTQFLVWDAPMYEEIFQTVRAINQSLPEEKRLRLLLSDPPIDWAKVNSGEDYHEFADRAKSQLRVIENEVLKKNHRALIVIGGNHLARLGLDADFENRLTDRSALGQRLSQKYREEYLAIMTAIETDRFGERLKQWQAPRLENLSQSSIGELSAGLGMGTVRVQRVVNGSKTWVPINPDDYPSLKTMYDMVLYLGSDNSNVSATAGTYLDQSYVTELRRRAKVLDEYYQGLGWERQLDRTLERAQQVKLVNRQDESEDSDSIKIPLVDHPQQIMLQVNLNGKGPYHVTFDTGSSIVACVDNTVVKELSLPVVGTTMNSGGTGRAVERDLVKLDTIEIADLKFNGGRALTHDYSWISPKGSEPVKGILGFQLFRDWILTIDYPNKVMRLSKETDDGEKGNVVSYTQRDNRPYINVEVGKEKFSALIDTGATSGIVLPGRLRKEMEFETEPVVIGRMRSVNGLGGRVWRGKIKGSIKVANMQVDQPVVSFFEGRDRTVIGSEFLKDYAVTFDQKKRKVKFERSKAE